jgi:hypothetical protein
MKTTAINVMVVSRRLIRNEDVRAAAFDSLDSTLVHGGENTK